MRALQGASLRIEKGEFIAVCGPSGSGKTTLLMMIAAMLQPSRGTVRFDEKDVYAMTGPERARFRAQNIGFVFQMFHLVPYLNVLENVLVAGGAIGKRDAGRASDLLQRLGLRTPPAPQARGTQRGREATDCDGPGAAESAEADPGR